MFIKLLNLILPGFCYSCGIGIADNCCSLFFCPECLAKLNKIDCNNCCKVCGYPIDKNEVLDKLFKKYIECPSCEDKKRHFDIARSVYVYDNLIRKMILMLKYNFQTESLPFIGKNLLNEYLKMPKADVICFVPITRSKLFWNGFNHAGLIANSFFSILIEKNKNDIHEIYIHDLLVKTQKTIQSKKLSREGRTIKQHHFEVNCKYKTDDFVNKFHDKTFLIIDDIITTGATMDAVAEILKKTFSNCKVECLSFARTMLY